MVRDSLRERERLLRERPHLVQPLRFLLAHHSGSRRSALNLRTALWLYRRMAKFDDGLEAAEFSIRKLERVLDSGRRWSIFSYEDAQCAFPERLVAEWIVEAARAGAVVRNHTQVLAIDVRHGRVQGALIRDLLTRHEERVQATWIVNATGPWVDRLCQRSRISVSQPMVGGVRGSHIVLPRFPGAPDSAVYSEGADRRSMFVVPWNDQLLVGTTEVADTADPEKAKPSSEEIESLLQHAQQLFPRSKIAAEDIRFVFAGIRPLPFSPDRELADISRKTRLIDHQKDGAAQMVSVVGGRLSTAAATARKVTAKLLNLSKPSHEVALLEEGGSDLLVDGWRDEIARVGGISEGSAEAIVEIYGKRSMQVARLAATKAEMRAPLCAHTPHIVAEAVDAFTSEFAANLADALLRRVPVALGPCWSQPCSRTAAGRVGAAMGWNEFQSAAELETLELDREAFLQKPARQGLAMPAAAD